MNMRPWAVGAIIAVAVCPGLELGQTRKDSKSRTITMNEGRELVYAMLRADGWTNLPGFVIVDPYINPEFPDFYIIHATYDSDGSGIGHYAVARTTGDVWDWAICGRFTSSALLKAQQVLRKRIGLTDVEYRNLRKPGPFCEPAEAPQVLKMGRPRSDAASKSVENRK
jgi:hypothetical protein